MQLRGQVDGMPFCVIERTLSQGIFAGLPYEFQWAGRLSRLTRPPVVVGQGERRNSSDHLSDLSAPLGRPFEVVEDCHDDLVVLFR